MAAKPIATLLRNSASASVLLALLLISDPHFCGGSLIDLLKISRDDNPTIPETTILQGKLRGINMVTHKNRTLSGFLGIPYAKPPVRELRFRAPLPADKWNGTYDASIEASHCPYMNETQSFVGDEDCLNLNVFTPQLPTGQNSASLPVMVFILGGAFNTGTNTLKRYGPDLLLDKDVVLVVPNFRVGVLSYLTTGDEVSPGNYGLKDAVLALKWVQENIKYFGGDSNQVTLFGASSGSISVHLLTLSNLTQGLFHKYITQSGTAYGFTINQPRDVGVNRAVKLGQHFGCPTNSSTLLVNCLREFNASQLIDTIEIFYEWNHRPDNVWFPMAEPDIDGALLPDRPENLHKAGNIRDLPWLASIVRDEGLMVSISYSEDPDLFEDFLSDIPTALPIVLQYGTYFDDASAFTDALTSYYFNDLTADRRILLANLTQLMGDCLFIYPTYRAFKHHLALAESPQYLASFEYRGTFSHSYLFSGGSTDYTGVTHGDEVIYLFGHQGDRLGPAEDEFNEADLFMVDTMVQLWTSFAANGSPTTPDSISTTVWEPYSSRNNHLRIGNQSDTALEMQYDLFLERMQLWDELMEPKITSSGNPNQLRVLPLFFVFVIRLCIFCYFDL